RLANRELFGRLATAAMLPAVTELCARWRPDVIVREPTEYASAVVSCRAGVPMVQVAISLAQVEAGSLDLAAPALSPVETGVVEALRAAPYLTTFPAALDPSPFPTTIRFHEPRRPGAVPPLADWWPDSDAPLLYVTLGTVVPYMSVAAARFRALLDAVADLDVRVLLTVGRVFDAAALGSVPRNVHVEAWVDQATVLSLARAVVCHGGSGTLLGALAAGVPLVVVPVFGDQVDNGRRVAAAGAGVVADGDPPAALISERITSVVADTSYRDAARRIAREMVSTPTVDEALARPLAEAATRGVRDE
ncbi:MAG TPA: nucleotide disphospho-sugar-binding domain-containing protein, partial [Acidimicrobiia bacterium]|nr:nucleotide disphospho-sugar-binding domain-containing protein [Acidimicrobiia bacterium]